jgi:hypothetical protein
MKVAKVFSQTIIVKTARSNAWVHLAIHEISIGQF